MKPVIKYELPVSEKTNEVDKQKVPLEIQDMIKEYRDKFSYLSEYPNFMFLNSTDMIHAFGKKHIDELTDISIHKYESDEVYAGYKYKCDNHVVFANNYKFIDTDKIMLIFYKDYDKITEDLKNIDLRYDYGTYAIEKTCYGYRLISLDLSDSEIPILEDDLQTKIENNIDTFFSSRQFYKDNNLSYKRGILLYGSPGNGKTSLIKTILKNVNKKDIFCIILRSASMINEDLNEFLKYILDDKPKIIILEDIDGIEPYNRSAILNFLDGIDSLQNTFIIGTTNFIEKVDSALVNRPSRFDRMYNIDLPSEKVRYLLLKRFFPTLSEKELKKYVELTKDFSCAYFKEIFIFTMLNNCSILKSIEDIKEQMNILSANESDMDYMG